MDQLPEQQATPVTSEQPQQQKKVKPILMISILVIFISLFCGIISIILRLQSHTNIKSKLNSSKHLLNSIDLTPTKSNLGPTPTYNPQSAYRLTTPTPDPSMANWKTYTDPGGFSMKYPPKYWEITAYPPRVIIKIQDPNSGRDPLGAAFTIDENTAQRNEENAGSIKTVKATDNETLTKIWQQLEVENKAAGIEETVTPEQIVIGGSPAIKHKIQLDLVDYVIVAPGLGKSNAEYFIGFGNPEIGDSAGMVNPYSEKDPFVQQQLHNFEKAVESMQFKK